MDSQWHTVLNIKLVRLWINFVPIHLKARKHYRCMLLKLLLMRSKYKLTNSELTYYCFSTEVLSNLQKYQKIYGDVYKLWVGPLFPTLVICDARNLETILSSTIHIKKSTSYLIFNSFLGDGLITNIGIHEQVSKQN